MASEARVAEASARADEERLAALEQAVTHLGRQVDEMADDSVLSAALSVVPGLKLRQPIPIVVEESAEDAVARWVESGLYGVGRNEGEAIESLREEICTVWHDLDSAPDSELTRHARTMREVLRCYVGPAS